MPGPTVEHTSCARPAIRLDVITSLPRPLDGLSAQLVANWGAEPLAESGQCAGSTSAADLHREVHRSRSARKRESDQDGWPRATPAGLLGTWPRPASRPVPGLTFSMYLALITFGSPRDTRRVQNGNPASFTPGILPCAPSGPSSLRSMFKIVPANFVLNLG